jgi:hypothetical protein
MAINDPYAQQPQPMFGNVLAGTQGMFGGLKRGFQAGNRALHPYSNRLMLAGMGMLGGGPKEAMRGLVAGSALDTEDADRRKLNKALQDLMSSESDLIPDDPAIRGLMAADDKFAEATLLQQMKPHDPLDQYSFTEVDGVLMRVNKYTGQSEPVYGTAGGGTSKSFERERQTRQDATGDPQFKRFQEAVPVYQSMVETGGSNTKFSDLNLVYGLAKIMDPTSVVREGEQILVRDASGLTESIVGQINALNGGAALTPATRTALMKEAKSRMQEYRKAAAQQQGFYGAVADEYGIPRGRVIPPLQDLGEFEAGDEPFTVEP